MIDVKQYILTIVAASVIASIVLGLTEKATANKKLIQLITGVFLLLTVLSPLKEKLNFQSFLDIDDITHSAEENIMIGQQETQKQVKELITEQVATYIQDRATALGANLSVSVTISSDDPPIPTSVRLKGNVSPYVKSKLKEIIANDIGISEDHQTWT